MANTIVFYNKAGPVIVPSLPDANKLGNWTYAVCDGIWHWVVMDRFIAFGGGIHKAQPWTKQWRPVAPQLVPKKVKLTALIMS